jgi:hypothetical protein
MVSACPRFPYGAVVRRRDVLDGRDWISYPVRVVADTTDLVALYLSHGTRLTFGTGAFAWGTHPWARIADRWQSPGVLQLHRPGRAHSTWVTRSAETAQFQGWYVNLEAPLQRAADGFSTLDHEIDLIIPAGSDSCLWKDVDEFEHRVTQGHFSRQEAARIRAEAASIAHAVRVGAQWWDAAWAQWAAPDGWGPLPAESLDARGEGEG